jgi:hypothetical protein
MERLYLPPSLRYLDPMRVVGGVPLDHASLVYDLIEALRPQLVVDVGAGPGVAFSVACQSMRDHDVDGLAYAVDAWADDEGKPEDDPTRWASLNDFLRAHFRGVAYLMKMPPAEALQHFAAGSVGVVRLDAVRAGAPLSALIEAWLPRLGPGGVMLCPGVTDPEHPELAEDWQRALAGQRTLVFPHGKGVGLLYRAPASEHAILPELVELFCSQDAGELEGLARFYEHADRHHALRMELQEKRGSLVRKK